MNKYRTLKAVGFFVVLAAVVAFLALPDSQAANGRPIRWKATVSGDMSASGEFVGGVDHVNINNGVGTNPESCGPAGNSYSYLELQLFTPSLQVNMNGFSGDYVLPSPYGFPKTIAKTWPDCAEEFLNSNFHPTPEYPHVILRFTTCGCGNNKDLMAMTEGEILPVHMMLLFFAHNWYTLPTSASTPVPYTFLNLNMNAHGYVKTGVLPDVYIQRVGNVWTVHVDTLFDNSLYQDTLQDYNSYDWPVKISDNILGQYATYVPSTNKKGKTTWTTTYHYPRAKAPLQFQIAFTKY